MGEDRKFSVVDPPHLSSGETVPRAMLDTILALVPVACAAVWFYRLNAVFLIAVCLVAALLTDLVVRRIKGKGSSVCDKSVLVTGFILALCFGPLTNWWVAVFATVIAVAIGKEWMGGLGWNRFNPAALGRASVILLAPVVVFLNQQFAALRVSFPLAPEVLDSMTGATPLALLKHGIMDISYKSLLIGYPGGGALVETSALLVLIGGAYLLYRKHITWHIPASMLGTVMVLTAVLGRNPVEHVLTGGLLFGALFMATDWVTSPITDPGRIIYGVLIGALVVLFRIGLGPTEGVIFSILIMNAFVPVIDRLTRRKVFGQVTATRTA